MSSVTFPLRLKEELGAGQNPKGRLSNSAERDLLHYGYHGGSCIILKVVETDSMCILIVCVKMHDIQYKHKIRQPIPE